MKRLGRVFFSSSVCYEKSVAESLRSPEAFWAKQAAEVQWFQPPTASLVDGKWFTGGQLNTCYNAVDVHAENPLLADEQAVLYDSPLTQTQSSLTYKQLLDKVSVMAGGLAKLGVKKGDVVIIYMPMIPEAIIAMLSCARLGAIHCVVFGGFASRELANRIEDTKPKVIISASCGMEANRIINYKLLLNNALDLISSDARNKLKKCVIVQRPQMKAPLEINQDLDYDEMMTSSLPHDCVPVAANDPLYIIYTSGTTGQPKGIVRENGGHAVALKYSMKNLFNTMQGETFWAASDIGWTVGHSYGVYGPLLQGCRTVLYEGKPTLPKADVYWRICQQYNVKTLFTAPTALRAIRKEDPHGHLLQPFQSSLTQSLQAIFVAGERADPNTLSYFLKQFQHKIPIIDHWWQTESGWPIVSHCLGLTYKKPQGSSQENPYWWMKLGSVGTAVPGYDVQVKYNDEDEDKIEGNLLIKLPLPPGFSDTLYQQERGFEEKYLSKFPGFYDTGDAGHIDDQGYIHVMSRTDDIINVAGHRLSTGALEEIILGNQNVAECAVIGVHDSLKGQKPLAFIVRNSDCILSDDEVMKDASSRIRSELGGIATLKGSIMVDNLPKTRSGKILRKILQAIAEERPYPFPATIENEDVLQDITKSIQTFNDQH